MKYALIVILFFVMAMPCFAQFTEQTMRQIIREELEPVKLDIAEMKGRMEGLEGRMRSLESRIGDLEGKMESLDSRMRVMEGKMAVVATKDDIITVTDKIHFLYRWFITMWVTIILAVFGIPYLYGRSDRERVKELATKLREDEHRFEELRTEVEALKALRENQERLRETARKIAEEKPEFAEAYRMVGLL